MGSSDSQAASQSAFSDQARLSARGYGIAMPALATQAGSIQQALALGGEPGYVKDAFEASRAGEIDAGTNLQRGAIAQADRQAKGAVAGGNMGAALNPSAMGSGLADALFGSRVNQAASRLDETNKLYGLEAGQAAQTGSASIGAEGQAIGAIGGMRAYNPTYANILGALNAGGAVYGGFNQSNANQAFMTNQAAGRANAAMSYGMNGNF
jgi:hypothetical protein